jgi:hypothetical protein
MACSGGLRAAASRPRIGNVGAGYSVRLLRTAGTPRSATVDRFADNVLTAHLKRGGNSIYATDGASRAQKGDAPVGINTGASSRYRALQREAIRAAPFSVPPSSDRKLTRWGSST